MTVIAIAQPGRRQTVLRLQKLDNTVTDCVCQVIKVPYSSTQPMYEALHRKQGIHMPFRGTTCQTTYICRQRIVHCSRRQGQSKLLQA
jgi:hypothetical protein